MSLLDSRVTGESSLEIHCEDNMVFSGNRLIVPVAMRAEMLQKLHEGHLGMEKCKARAREVMYWPNMTRDIDNMVAKCTTCVMFRKQNQKQPMIPHEMSERPWAKLGADIFTFKEHDYLIVVDYFSKYPEVSRLVNKTAKGVINALKPIFARHGIPDTLVCDNMPFVSHTMAEFADSWGFQITTSSPRYAQSNGQSEKFVGIVKSFLRKAHEEERDPHISLLQYRNTPTSGAPYSPAQLLMSRCLKDKLPSTANVLTPNVVSDGKSVLQRRQRRQKYFYDRNAKDRRPHEIGDSVRVRLNKTWDNSVVTITTFLLCHNGGWWNVST